MIERVRATVCQAVLVDGHDDLHWCSPTRYARGRTETLLPTDVLEDLAMCLTDEQADHLAGACFEASGTDRYLWVAVEAVCMLFQHQSAKPDLWASMGEGLKLIVQFCRAADGFPLLDRSGNVVNTEGACDRTS